MAWNGGFVPPTEIRLRQRDVLAIYFLYNGHFKSIKLKSNDIITLSFLIQLFIKNGK